MRFLAGLFGWIFFFSIVASSADTPEASEARLLSGFEKNVVDSFTGNNLWLHGAAFASTYIIVQSNYDAHVYNTFKHQDNALAAGGAVLGAGVGAAIAGTSLYLTGRNTDDTETIGAAYAIAQSALITFGYVVLLKVTTGRAHPTNSWHMDSADQSRQFQLGFMRNGATAYGWPSGHVSHTVAVTSALAHYYPEKKWLAWLGGGLSMYMLYSISAYDSAQMHWFSDGIAGAFIGYAIGSSVGKNHRTRFRGATADSNEVSWIPVVGPGLAGLKAYYLF